MRQDLAAGRFMFLGKCLEDCTPEVRQEITNEVLDQLEDLALNDKKKLIIA